MPATVVPSSEAQISTETAAAVLNGVLAVEQHAPELPGPTKAQLVLDTVNTAVTAAPAILSLIQMFVSVFNQRGAFKKSK